MFGLESVHFKNKELRCRCCGENHVVYDLLLLAEEIRELIGYPMHVTCAYRCKMHNIDVGGVLGSQHTLGRAMDFYVKEVPAEKVYQILLKAHREGKLKDMNGLFLYRKKNFIHVDVRKDYFRTNIYE